MIVTVVILVEAIANEPETFQDFNRIQTLHHHSMMMMIVKMKVVVIIIHVIYFFFN